MKLRALVFLALSLLALPAGAQDVPAIQPVGPPIRISDAAQTAALPRVASAPDGSFLVVWLADLGSTPASYGLFARRHDATGHPLNDAVLVSNVSDLFSRPRAAIGPDGTTVVVWTDGNPALRIQRLAADGRPVGDVIQIEPPDDCCQATPDIASLGTGGFVVVWVQFYEVNIEPLGFPEPIQALFLDAAGHPQGELIEVSEFGFWPRVAAAPDGGFAVAWEDGPLFVRRFAANGAPAGPQVTAALHGFGPVPVFDPDGGLSVVWAHIGTNSFVEPTNVFARRIGATAATGPEIPLGDGSILDMRPDAAADRQGNKVVVWAAPGAAEDAPSQIVARAFDVSWQPQGPAVRAGLFTKPKQTLSPLSTVPPKGPAVAAGTSSVLTVWDGLQEPTDKTSQAAGQILGGSCFQDAGDLCLAGGRFRVEVAWRNAGTGATGTGTAVPLTADTGSFWFFNAANLELLVKVLDGRGVNGHWWVFFGALTDVEYDLTVTDLQTGNHKTYHNPAGTQASRADVEALPDGTGSESAQTPATTAPAASSSCAADGEALCLNGERYRVSVAWTDPRTGASGRGHAVPVSGDSGYFWFFGPGNVELMVKVLDGRPANGHVWVFYAALSDVDYTITVTDTVTEQVKTYHNPAGTLASRADTAAF
jgi:hypothetical protein